MGKNLTTLEFIVRAQKIHETDYDYYSVNYVDTYTKILIICPAHGEFEQTPRAHLNGQGCPKCATEIRSNLVTNTTEEFIKKAVEIHGDKYDYSVSEYTKSKNPITIKCKIHGEFTQQANSHIQGRGCKQCQLEGFTARTEFGIKGEVIGLYKLYAHNELVYVGKSSRCIQKRVRRHTQDKVFDTVEILQIATLADMDLLELYYINKYCPKYNKDSNSGTELTLHISNENEAILTKTQYSNKPKEIK